MLYRCVRDIIYVDSHTTDRCEQQRLLYCYRGHILYVDTTERCDQLGLLYCCVRYICGVAQDRQVQAVKIVVLLCEVYKRVD